MIKELKSITKNKNPLSDKEIEGIFKKIDLIQSKINEQITKLNQLKLSLLQEQIKRSKNFYLARSTRKQIEPIMRRNLVLFREAFGKDPSWYIQKQLGLTIENFWINQRTTWNKAHGLEWNNNKDPNTKQLMEYKK